MSFKLINYLTNPQSSLFTVITIVFYSIDTICNTQVCQKHTLDMMRKKKLQPLPLRMCLDSCLACLNLSLKESSMIFFFIGHDVWHCVRNIISNFRRKSY